MQPPVRPDARGGKPLRVDDVPSGASLHHGVHGGVQRAALIESLHHQRRIAVCNSNDGGAIACFGLERLSILHHGVDVVDKSFDE